MKGRAAVAALLVGAFLAVGVVAPVAAVARVPKVALIVGPVGSITASYRTLANQAAAVARKAGAQVVKVYSPDATWPAVRQAITGASIVVYLGHGNGFPSRYRDALFPPSQDGFGLNPVAGVDDSAHQYFGEASIDNVRLAPHAVVLLSHLCYASGNSEPGLAEGTLDTAIQRVDNYAAGFIRAGAEAVVAEAHMGPAWYVGQLLQTSASIESIWNRSPSRNGHVIPAASVRSPGFTARLDPDNASSGFYRSIVSRGGTAGDLRAGASGSASARVVGPPPVPTLANASVRFGTMALAGLPIASTSTELTLPITTGSIDRIPKDAQVGLRWDPVLLDPLPTAPQPAASPSPAESPSPSSSPSGSAAPGESLPPAAALSGGSPAPSGDPSVASPGTPGAGVSASPQAVTASPSVEPTPASVVAPTQAASPSPAAPMPAPTNSVAHGMFTLPSAQPVEEPTPTPSDAPDVVIPTEAPAVDLVVPERVGSVVDLSKAKHSASGLTVGVTYPAQPGLYRLVPTLHTGSGVAYDAATQALLVPVLVRVGGEIAVAYGAPSTLTLAAGMEASVPVRVLNSGSADWDVAVMLKPGEAGDPNSAYRTSHFPAILSATWVSTTAAPVPAATTTELDGSVSGPGGSASVSLDVVAPDAPGEYLLLLDVVSPSRGPLSALGSAPAIVRVTVSDPGPSPTPVPPQLRD